MTMISVQLPIKGFTEQSQFSAVPEGMTPSCLNVLPIDPWNGRIRIGTRTGTQLFNSGAVQFMDTYRAYVGGTLVEKIIFVRAGKIYYADPHDVIPVTASAFGGQASTTFLNTTGMVEGVQFNEYFYFVDGDHYVVVNLTDPTGASAVSSWGHTSPSLAGPYHTDPAGTVNAGERATLICRWGARLVLAGYKRTPNVWFACAPDEPYPNAGSDGWDSANNLQAVGGGTGENYGTLGDPVVAIFPFAQSGLMFACTNSFSFLTTDPVFGDNASMVSLTKSIGIAGQRAWCSAQEKGAYILANDGLYFLNANDFNFNRASRISAGRLDSFFLRLDFGTPAIGGSSNLAGGTTRNLQTDSGSATGSTVYTQTIDGTVTTDGTDTEVTIPQNSTALIGTLSTGEIFPCVCYDPDREGVWVFLSVSGVESSSVHLYYDIKTESFWPQKFADPLLHAPTSAVYVGTSRAKSGAMYMGGSSSIGAMYKSFPVGIDGFSTEMTDATQQAQFVRSSLTVGPIMTTLPYRMHIGEVRVDLSDDAYELPTGFIDRSVKPILSISTGETAQQALGLQSDTLYVTNLNSLTINGGESGSTSPSVTYNGGTAVVSVDSTIDGRFAVRPFGQFTQKDIFAIGSSRVYTGPQYWVIRWNTSNLKWEIAKDLGGGSFSTEYQQVTGDIGNSNGSMVTVIQNPISPALKDNASISGASFPNSFVTEIGSLDPGRNNAKKCRIRSEAAYLTIAADGHPWSIERMSVQAAQVGKSRGVV